MNNNYQKCKYQFFLNIIDKNRKVYKKDHYLFLDFVFKDKGYKECSLFYRKYRYI